MQERVFRANAQQPRSHVNQGGDEEVGRRVRVQAPRTPFQLGLLELAQHQPTPFGFERLADDVVQQDILGREHGAPDHFAFPTAIGVLDRQQAIGCPPQRGVGGVLRRVRLTPGPWIPTERLHGGQKRARQLLLSPFGHVVAAACLLPQFPNGAQEVSEAHRQRLNDVAGLVPGNRVVGAQDRPGNGANHDRVERKAQTGERCVFTGEQAHGLVAELGIGPPVLIDSLPEHRRLHPMIREHLVQTHGKELGCANFLRPPGGELVEALPVGQGERIAETEGHAHRGQRVVMPRRVADEHSTGVPIGHPGSQLVGRGLVLSRSQGFNKPGTDRFRQQAGVGLREHADPVPGVPMAQRHVRDDAHLMRSQAKHENRTRPAQHHVPVTFIGQGRPFGHQTDHPGAGHALGGQAQRLTHHRGPAVGTDNPCGWQGLHGAVQCKSEPVVLDCPHPRTAVEVHAGFVGDRGVQS